VEITQSLPVLGPLGQSLFDAITDGRFQYYNHPDLKSMATGVVAREITAGLHIKKGQVQADIMVALSFAFGAVNQKKYTLEYSPVNPFAYRRQKKCQS